MLPRCCLGEPGIDIFLNSKLGFGTISVHVAYDPVHRPIEPWPIVHPTYAPHDPVESIGVTTIEAVAIIQILRYAEGYLRRLGPF